MADKSTREPSETTSTLGEVYFQTLFDHGTLGIVTVDCVGGCRILECNRRFAKMLGYRRSELVGRNPISLTHADHVNGDLRYQQDLVAGKQVSYTTEKRFLDKQGRSVWSRVTMIAIPHNGQSPRIALLISEDISQQKASESRLQAEDLLLRQMIQLQDSERRLVSCEIHDGLTQDIVGAQMMLQALSAGFESRSQPVPEELDKALENLQRATSEARRLMSELRPMILEEMGVVESIRALVDREQAASDVAFTFISRVHFSRLSDLLEGTLFRIVQESVNNIKRHSRATKARIRLTQVDPQNVVLEIQDDGIGFDTAAVPSNRGGLDGIRERARLFGGYSSIETAPGKGTRITVKLPLRGSEKSTATAVQFTV